MTETSQLLKDQLMAGESAMESGNDLVALAHFAMVLTEVPTHAKVRKHILKMRMQSGLPGSLTQGDMNQLVAMVQKGAFELATNQSRILIAIAPKEPILHNVLGMCLSNLGFYQDGVNAFGRAIKLNPGYAEAHLNLGATLVQLGRHDQAESYLKRAISLNAALSEAHNNLAAVYQSKGDLEAALASIDKALRLRSDYPNALNTKGLILRGLSRLDAAIAAFDKGLAQAPNDAGLRINRGFTLAENGAFEEGLAEVESALPDVTDKPIQYQHYGVLLSQMGRTEDAIKAFETALEMEPGLSEAWRLLSLLRKTESTDPAVAELEARLETETTEQYDRLHLGFALGKIHQDLGHSEKMFHYLAIGNSEKRKLVAPYSTKARHQEVAAIRQNFGAPYQQRLAAGANPSDAPIFILGMNHSGTTGMGEMLASHPAIRGGKDLFWLDNEIRKTWKDLPGYGPKEGAALARGYLDFAASRLGEAAHFIDTFPGNFNWIGIIKAVLPNARIIHMTRDPRDLGLANYGSYFEGGGNQYTYDLVEFAEYYASYIDLMAFWHHQFPGQIHDCAYEDLVRDPEGQARAMLDLLDLDHRDAVLQGHEVSRPNRPAQHGQWHEKLTDNTPGTWKAYERELAPLIEALSKAGCLPG